jgi:aquaporin NIP
MLGAVAACMQILAEIFGTYFLIFAGCAAVAVNLRTGGTVTFPGICIVWGLAVMVMVYSVGHISGAHLNPAVSVAFATCGRFPWRQVPAYAAAQVMGATAASLTLRLLFGNAREHFFGTVPAGSDVQSLVIEFIISFNLMFVVSGVATDNRAVSAKPFNILVLILTPTSNFDHYRHIYYARSIRHGSCLFSFSYPPSIDLIQSFKII